MIGRRAIEFFSGMGSFAEACRGANIDVVAAFDQDVVANKVYEHNFSNRPINTTLDSIPLAQIPDAEIWWMSPPCTPYSVRGKRDDLNDPRAKSLSRLMDFLPERLPSVFFLENVRGFEQSAARLMVASKLKRHGYAVSDLQLCSTDFGTPMKRPRYFLIGHRSKGERIEESLSRPQQSANVIELYLSETFDESLIMDPAEYFKFEACLNIVDANDAQAICICFTRGYYRCRLASGSLLRMPDGRIRRFSSQEMLRLFGFSSNYTFPAGVSEERAAGLLGNSVDVRMIQHLLKTKVTPLREPPVFQSTVNSTAG